jgi:hypothetical protein
MCSRTSRVGTTPLWGCRRRRRLPCRADTVVPGRRGG